MTRQVCSDSLEKSSASTLTLWPPLKSRYFHPRDLLFFFAMTLILAGSVAVEYSPKVGEWLDLSQFVVWEPSTLSGGLVVNIDGDYPESGGWSV